MSTTIHSTELPPPEQVRERIAITEDELKALSRLLRASIAWTKAEDARRRRESLAQGQGATGE